MKRIVSLFFACILFLSLIACSSEKEKTESVFNNDSNSEFTTTNNVARINLNDYVSVTFMGVNSAGSGWVSFDREKFLLDHIGNISFNKENVQVYKELYGNTDKSAANTILEYISIGLNKNGKLSNGDTVETVWCIDTEKIETYFEWNYTCSSQKFTVTGLTDAGTFDPFEKVQVIFSEIAPYGKASVYNGGSNYGGTYKVFPNENLKNGDKVKVTYSCSDKSTMIAQYGKYPSSFEKTYTVSGLNSYVQSFSELSDEQRDKLVSAAAAEIWVLGYGNYKEAKYCGNYFYTAKGKPAQGVYFLTWCGLPVGNAVCFVFEHPVEIGVTDSPNAYTVIKLENLLIDENGELTYRDMSRIRDDYKSKESLEKAFVGVFDDIMYCANNVNFD